MAENSSQPPTDRQKSGLEKPDPRAVRERVSRRLDFMEEAALSTIVESWEIYEQLCEDLQEEERMWLRAAQRHFGRPMAEGGSAKPARNLSRAKSEMRLELAAALKAAQEKLRGGRARGKAMGGLEDDFTEAASLINGAYNNEKIRGLTNLNAIIDQKAEILNRAEEAGRREVRDEQKRLAAWYMFQTGEKAMHVVNGVKGLFNRASGQSRAQAFRDGYRQQTGLQPPACIIKNTR